MLISRGKMSVSGVRKVSQCCATLGAAVPLALMTYIPRISPEAAVALMMVSYGLNAMQYTGAPHKAMVGCSNQRLLESTIERPPTPVWWCGGLRGDVCAQRL